MMRARNAVTNLLHSLGMGRIFEIELADALCMFTCEELRAAKGLGLISLVKLKRWCQDNDAYMACGCPQSACTAWMRMETS